MPSLQQLLIEAAAQSAHTYFKEEEAMYGNSNYGVGLDATVSIDRLKLIQSLVDKRSAIEVAFDALVVEAEATVASVVAAGDAWKDYYIELGERLTKGKAVINVEGEPRNGEIGIKGGPKQPPKYNHDWMYARQRLQGYQQERESVLASFDGILDLLRLSTDVVVSVPVGQHQHLMGMTVNNYRSRW